MTRENFIKLMDTQVKLIRSEYGLTQDKMSMLLGLSKKTLVEIEKELNFRAHCETSLLPPRARERVSFWKSL